MSVKRKNSAISFFWDYHLVKFNKEKEDEMGAGEAGNELSLDERQIIP